MHVQRCFLQLDFEKNKQQSCTGNVENKQRIADKITNPNSFSRTRSANVPFNLQVILFNS